MDRQAHGITKSLCLGWIVSPSCLWGDPTLSHLEFSHIFPQPKGPPPVPTLKVDPSQRPRRWRLKSPPLHWDPSRINNKSTLPKKMGPKNPGNLVDIYIPGNQQLFNKSHGEAGGIPRNHQNKSFKTPTNPSTNPGGS